MARSEPVGAVLTDAFADNLAASFRRVLYSGFGGWIDDDLAFTKPWGFRMGNVRVPVTVWQGQQDFMVPAAHGRWLPRRWWGCRGHDCAIGDRCIKDTYRTWRCSV